MDLILNDTYNIHQPIKQEFGQQFWKISEKYFFSPIND